ncbi:MAG: TolC family protein [Nitrospira sp.]|nr:TolC family protein [Nitrospira sp.]
MTRITVLRTAISLANLLLICGCMVKPYVLTEEDVRARALTDLQEVSKVPEPVTGPIDLYEALARALKYNLDAKVKAMQAQLAHQQLDVAHYALLPQVSVNAGFDGRNNYTGGVGRSLVTGRQAVEPFTSSERHVYSGNLALSWDVLDFGLSFVRAQQAADSVMIAEEEKRRIAVRLEQEVRSAYWRAVSAERVLHRIQFLDESVRKALSDTRLIVDKKLQALLTPLTYRRELLTIQREVHRLYRDLATAKTQLASLMGLPPGTVFDLVVRERTDVLPTVQLDQESMERQALLFRAELRTIDYQKRINAKEAKAVLLELFPSLKLHFGGYYNSNMFLLNQNWVGYAAQVSYNLLSAFRVPAKLKAVEAHRQVLNSQSMALSLAILTEVQIGAAQLMYAKQEYQDARAYQETQTAIAEQTKNLWLTRSANDLIMIREQVSDVLAEVRLDSAQSAVETAYATLKASMGEDIVPAGIGGQNVAQLADTLRQLWEPALSRASDTGRRPEVHAQTVSR